MADIKHAIPIAAPVERVHSLVATAAGLSQWWADDVEESGGKITLGFMNRATVYRLRPISIAPTQVEWECESGKEWSGTRLRFSLQAQDGKTLVRFAHLDWEAETDYFISCNTTWGELMFRLKSAAETQNARPLFSVAGMAY